MKTMINSQRVVHLTVVAKADVYKETIGDMPKLYSKRCIASYAVASDWDGTISSKMKDSAIHTFWHRVGGTGSQNIAEKRSHDLFNIEVA